MKRSNTSAPVVTGDPLFELLAAYQYLQGHNVRMASDLSFRLGVRPTDLQREPERGCRCTHDDQQMSQAFGRAELRTVTSAEACRVTYSQ